MIAGLTAITSVAAPAFAASEQAVTQSTLAAPLLEKIAPDLREAVTTNTAVAQDFLRTDKAIRLGTAPAKGTVRVMVRTTGSLNSRALRLRLAQSGGKLGRTFVRAGLQVMDATPAQIALLASDKSVLSISPDNPTASTSSSLDVNTASIGAPEVTRLARRMGGSFAGQGVTVAVLDSGIAPVGDLAGRIVAFKDFVNGNDSTPYDDYGHGTHVAGIVAGSGAASRGEGAKRTYRGVAYRASIIGAKVLGAAGQGTVSDAIAGIEWCIANKSAYNIRVINMSLGTPVHESYKTDPLCQAAERAVAAGIVVVATAGNRGTYGSINAPGNDPAVITVGASNSVATARRSDDVITSYTSRGPAAIDATMKPDLVAPGNRVVSLRAPGSWIDTNQPQTNVSTSEYKVSAGTSATAYARISGSSMAAPAVAGAAAILLQANPQLSPSGVKAALMLSAQLISGKDPLRGTTGVYDPYTQGAGELNLPGALNIAMHCQPGVGLLGVPHTVSTIAGERFRWSIVTLRHRWKLQNAVPTTLLTGPALWATLGSSTVWTDDLVWGGSVSLLPGNGTVSVINASWGTGGDNASWNTGGDAPSYTEDTPSVPGEEPDDNASWNTGGDAPALPGQEPDDNASWNTGGDNASWNTGGDAPSYAEDTPEESAFVEQPEDDNASWNTGGDSVSWLTGADNASWNTGGDAPFAFAEGDITPEEEDNASWNTGGDSPELAEDEPDDNASWNTGGD